MKKKRAGWSERRDVTRVSVTTTDGGDDDDDATKRGADLRTRRSIARPVRPVRKRERRSRGGEGRARARAARGRTRRGFAAYLDEHLGLGHDLDHLTHVRSGLLQELDLLAQEPDWEKKKEGRGRRGERQTCGKRARRGNPNRDATPPVGDGNAVARGASPETRAGPRGVGNPGRARAREAGRGAETAQI